MKCLRGKAPNSSRTVWPPHSKAPSKRTGATNDDVICELNHAMMTARVVHARADQLHGNLSCARARATPVLHISKVASALTPGTDVSKNFLHSGDPRGKRSG